VAARRRTGRALGTVHWTTHGRALAHPNPHIHSYIYNRVGRRWEPLGQEPFPWRLSPKK